MMARARQNTNRRQMRTLMEQWRHADALPCSPATCERTRFALQEHETRFRWLIENTSDLIAEVDGDGIIHYASPSVERVLGYTPTELLGTNGFELIHPDDLPHTREIFAQIFLTPGVMGPPLELRSRHRDGSWRYIEAIGKCLTDESGQPILVFCLRDITERKRAEAALAERTRQLEVVRAISEEVTRELDLTRLLDLIHRRAAGLVGADRGVISLWDEGTQRLVTRAWHGYEAWLENVRPRLGQGVVGYAAQRREGLMVNDYRTSPYANPLFLERTDDARVLCEPLLYHDSLLGVILVAKSSGAPPFTAENQQILRLFAAQAAIAIENARLFEATQRAAHEARSLYDVAHSLTTSLKPAEILHLIVVKSRELLGTSHAQVVLWDDVSQVLRLGAADGTESALVEAQEFRIGEGVNGIVAQTRAPLLVNDYPAFPQRVAGLSDLVAVIGVPLLYRDRFLGVLTSHTTTPGSTFTQEHLALLTSFADQAAVALENARLFQQEQRRRLQVEAVRAISEEITRELDLTALLQLITRRATELVGAAGGMVRLWDQATQRLIARAWHGVAQWLTDRSLELGEGVAGTAAQLREGLIVNNFRASPYATPLHLERTSHSAVLAEPLMYRDRLVGVILLTSEEPRRPFTAEDREILRPFATQAAIAIENARLYAELSQSYQYLQNAQSELLRAEKLRALGQMAAGIAHDLNNLLAAVLGQVDLLRLRVTDPTVLEALQPLETAATDGAHVVRRLQDFARKRALSPLAAMDLQRAVQESLEITRPQWNNKAERQGRAIEVVTAFEALPPILGYAPEVREALVNLILNAAYAMSNGGTLTFTGSATPDGGVILLVTDTGKGMAEEVCQRVFEPFFTTKGAKGTGLGLSVVYGIMERHGGSIHVTSVPGQGATFTLRFQAAMKGGSTTPSPAALVPAPRRILLIDDDPMVRGTIGSLLRAAGHTVIEADGGTAGLAALAESPVDCVLTDLGMEEMTGWDIARTIKTQLPRLPVILLTGWGEHASESGADKGMVDRILEKPVRLEELLRAIAELTADTRQPPPGI
jgi:PAS domain S-box-containing protein